MADNYLENRMEEYRSGRLASKSRTTTAMRSPKRHDTLTLHYPPMTVAVIAAELSPVISETIQAFTGVGCRVAFTAANNKEGNALAQRSGARFYPSTFTHDAIIADLTARWGAEPDLSVIFTVTTCHGTHRSINAVKWLTAPVAADITARHILYLAHPDNAFLSD